MNDDRWTQGRGGARGRGRGRGPTSNALDHLFEHSTSSSGLQMLAWLNYLSWLVYWYFNLSVYIREHRPLSPLRPPAPLPPTSASPSPPYVRLMSTHIMNKSSIPHFCRSHFRVLLWTQKVKTGRLGIRLGPVYCIMNSWRGFTLGAWYVLSCSPPCRQLKILFISMLAATSWRAWRSTPRQSMLVSVAAFTRSLWFGTYPLCIYSF